MVAIVQARLVLLSERTCGHTSVGEVSEGVVMSCGIGTLKESGIVCLHLQPGGSVR